MQYGMIGSHLVILLGGFCKETAQCQCCSAVALHEMLPTGSRSFRKIIFQFQSPYFSLVIMGIFVFFWIIEDYLPSQFEL